MSFSLLSKFFGNARGVIFKDANNVTWAFNKSTNEITANAGSFASPTTGTFVLTPTGGTGFSPGTVTASYTLVGSFFEVIIPVTNGTSNAATFTLTGTIPAGIIPATTKWFEVGPVQDNGSFTKPVQAKIAAGVITFAIGGSASSWTNTGPKGISSPIAIVGSTS